MLGLRPVSIACWMSALCLSCGSAASDRTASDRTTRDQDVARAALVGGTIATGDPAVVAIVSKDGRRLRCTGTLVAERVVLTAAHCDVQTEAASLAVAFGPSFATPEKLVSIVEAVAHPAFDGTATHDVAVVLLAEPAVVPPVPLTPQAVFAGALPIPLRLVGFGATAATTPGDGPKREGRAETGEVTPQSITLTAAPSLPCSGDSGGPVFATNAGGEQLVAVVSRGDVACNTYGRATRLDVNLDFVAPYVAATAAGVVPDGAGCLYPQHCQSGRCVAAADDARVRYCTRACGTEPNEPCAAPTVCTDGECRHPLPSPGALGAPCSDDRACVDGECLADGACGRRCVAGRGDCPSGYECALLSGVSFYCKRPVPPPKAPADEGCAMSRPSRGAGQTAALVVAIALVSVCLGRRSK